MALFQGAGRLAACLLLLLLLAAAAAQAAGGLELARHRCCTGARGLRACPLSCAPPLRRARRRHRWRHPDFCGDWDCPRFKERKCDSELEVRDYKPGAPRGWLAPGGRCLACCAGAAAPSIPARSVVGGHRRQRHPL